MFRVRTVFSGVTGSPWVNTAFFIEGTSSAQDCVDAVGAFWGAVDALMDSSVTWTTLADVETVDAATGQVTAVASTTPVTGTGSGGASGIPIAAQALVRWRTGVYEGGREIRGRWFIPGLGTGSNTDGVVTTASVTAIQTAAQALVNDPDTILCVWSRANNDSAAVTSASTWNQFAVLRSRRD